MACLYWWDNTYYSFFDKIKELVTLIFPFLLIGLGIYILANIVMTFALIPAYIWRFLEYGHF
jgi:hypothetical protein